MANVDQKIKKAKRKLETRISKLHARGALNDKKHKERQEKIAKKVAVTQKQLEQVLKGKFPTKATKAEKKAEKKANKKLDKKVKKTERKADKIAKTAKPVAAKKAASKSAKKKGPGRPPKSAE